MPKLISSSDIDTGKAQIVRKAPAPVPAKIAPDGVSDVLKEISVAIKRLVDLHNVTRLLIEKQLDPVDNTELLDRIATIQELTQQTLEGLRDAVSTRPDIPTFHPPTTRGIALEVTERDAWGRIRKITAVLDEKVAQGR